MDGYHSVRNYIHQIVQGYGKCTMGMKALFLDGMTTQIVSAVYSQTDMLSENVYYITRLDKVTSPIPSSSSSFNSTTDNGGGSSMNGSESVSDTSHMKAIVFIRPTSTNIDLLIKALQNPPNNTNTNNSNSNNNSTGGSTVSGIGGYAEYHIFLSNVLDSGLLRYLAENDIYEKIVQVRECYADFVPINNDLLTLQCHRNTTLAMTMAAGTSWAPQYALPYERHISGIQSILCTFQKFPSVIRYAAHSPCAEEIAKDIHDLLSSTNTTSSDLFQFRPLNRRHPLPGTPGSGGGGSSYHSSQQDGGCLLLILDRRDDPVTPLLSQWTYQAMVHELLGLNNHRVVLKGAPDITKDLEEVVLNANEDSFFKTNRYHNFGDLGANIQTLLLEHQKRTKQHTMENLNSIENMRLFLDKFPELRSQSHNVTKHVAIMGELARLVRECELMIVSEFEQSLACNDDHNTHWRDLMTKLQSNVIQIPDKLRLSLLYCLRYENIANLHMVQQCMAKGGVPNEMITLVPILLRYAGTKSRGPGLYGENDHLMSKMTKSFMSTVTGIQNVYSQHVPLVMDTIQAITRGKLSTKQYPYLIPINPNQQQQSSSKNNNHRKTTTTTTNSSSTSQQQQQHYHDNMASMIPDDIIIFMVGGVTYEEGTKIAEFNQQQENKYQQHQRQMFSSSTSSGTSNVGGGGGGSSGVLGSSHMNIRVVLAGSTIHNSTSFLDELRATTNNYNHNINNNSNNHNIL